MILIDGHNLIPKIKGLSLSDLDDEQQLIAILQDYCRVKRKTVEVYFDKAPLGQAGTCKYGNVKTHFIREGLTADSAIIQRIRKMGKQARQTRVVSSDQKIQREVRAFLADPVPSEVFAREIEKALAAGPSGGKPDAAHLSEEEIARWEQEFRKPRKD